MTRTRSGLDPTRAIPPVVAVVGAVLAGAAARRPAGLQDMAVTVSATTSIEDRMRVPTLLPIGE